MRTLPLLPLLALVLAGCAGGPSALPGDEQVATTSPTTTPSSSPPPGPPSGSPSAEPRLGILFDVTHDYRGQTQEVRRNFTVDRGVAKLRFDVESAGPPADGSFASAVMDVYAPGFTSAMFAELPAQERRNYTREMHVGDPWWGTWMVRFGGTGATSVTLRVTAE